MDAYADYNIGRNCRPGTGCYPGCSAFRSSVNSIMNNYGPPGNTGFNAVSREVIRRLIECETRPFVACPVIELPEVIIDVL